MAKNWGKSGKSGSDPIFANFDGGQIPILMRCRGAAIFCLNPLAYFNIIGRALKRSICW